MNSNQPEKSGTKVELTRRRLLQLAGTAGAGLAIARWEPSAFASTSGDTPLSGTSFPPQFWTAGNPAEALNWSPSTTPGAQLFRARIPLATRIAPLAATQAHPQLSSQPRLMNFMGHLPSLPYSNSYNDIYAMRSWQYHDIWGDFGGSDICPPQPAWTNAAHRNGVISLGMWYARGESWASCYAKADGSLYTPQDGTYIRLDRTRAVSYPLAMKMIEMAQYYGFDGWFLDWEVQPSMSSVDITQMTQFLQQLRLNTTKPLYVMMYDDISNTGQIPWYENELDNTNDLWESNGAADSIFANYWWYSSQNIITSTQTAAALKKDPFTLVYMGLDIEDDGLYPLQSQAPFAIPPNGSGSPSVSLALFNEWGYYKPLDPNDGAEGTAIQTPTQTAALYVAASQVYSGGTGNPASNNSDTGNYGIANFIAEKSVIGSLPFITRFNTGQGYQFFLQGAISSPNPWFNIGNQDILPTWQWWVKDYFSDSIPSGLLSVDFDLTKAYNGGSSIKVQGSLGPSNPTEVRLYKTSLTITAETELKVIYQEGSTDAAKKMQIGLIFADSPSGTRWLNPNDQGQAGRYTINPGNGWNAMQFQLQGYEHRVIAAISVGFVEQDANPAANYQINIGELSLLDGGVREAPATPRSFAINASQQSTDGTTAQLYLSWEFDPTVWYYDIYALVDLKGNRQWLGRTYDEVYYVNNLQRSGAASQTLLQLTATSKTGEESTPNTIRFAWS